MCIQTLPDFHPTFLSMKLHLDHRIKEKISSPSLYALDTKLCNAFDITRLFPLLWIILHTEKCVLGAAEKIFKLQYTKIFPQQAILEKYFYLGSFYNYCAAGFPLKYIVSQLDLRQAIKSYLYLLYDQNFCNISTCESLILFLGLAQN